MSGDKEQFKIMYEHHRKTATEYAERSHERWNNQEVADGYSALSQAHNQFALICGRLAGVDLSQHEGQF